MGLGLVNARRVASNSTACVSQAPREVAHLNEAEAPRHGDVESWRMSLGRYQRKLLAEAQWVEQGGGV